MYYIVDPDELVEAADLEGFDAYDVYGSENKTCDDLNNLAKKVCDNLIKENCGCSYDFAASTLCTFRLLYYVNFTCIKQQGHLV